MKNSKLRRALLLVACAVLLVSVSVSATLAYLTSRTQVVTNTFSVGNVAITLDEGTVYPKDHSDPEMRGKHDNLGRTTVGNEYKLIPGKTYDKDPIVYVSEDSERAWLFVKVDNGIADIESDEPTDETIAQQMRDTYGWLPLEGVVGADNVWYYMEQVSGGEQKQVFANFTIDGDAVITDTHIASNIQIQAYAVQAEGFNSAAAAYEAAPCTWGE